MAVFYGAPNECLYKHSSKTYVSIPHLRDTKIHIINIKKIESVVAMVLDCPYGLTHQYGNQDDWTFLHTIYAWYIEIKFIYFSTIHTQSFASTFRRLPVIQQGLECMVHVC